MISLIILWEKQNYRVRADQWLLVPCYLGKEITKKNHKTTFRDNGTVSYLVY